MSQVRNMEEVKKSVRSVSQLVSHRPSSRTPSPESKAFGRDGEPQIITDEIGRGTIYS